MKKYLKVYPEPIEYGPKIKKMQTYYFTLSLKYDLCERLYTPGTDKVIMTAENGKRIQLPVQNLRPHVSTNGIKGRFRLIIDENNKINVFERMT